MSKIDDLIKECISPDGTILNMRDKFIGLRGAMELAGKPALANVKELVLYHLVPAPPNRVAEWIFMRDVKEIRSSGVTLGFDGLTMTLPIGTDDVYQENLNARY